MSRAHTSRGDSWRKDSGRGIVNDWDREDRLDGGGGALTLGTDPRMNMAWDEGCGMSKKATSSNRRVRLGRVWKRPC